MEDVFPYISRLHEEYSLALSWAEWLVGVSPHSRWMAYREDLDEILRSVTWQYPLRNNHRRTTTFNSIYEISQFVFIWRGLRDFTGTGLVERLRDILTGPDVFVREAVDRANSIRPRDVAFELYMASMMCQSGYFPSLENEADLILELYSRRIYFECKRPKSLKNLQSLLKAGMAQLERRIVQDNSSCKGVLIICADKIVNPNFSIHRSDSVEDSIRTAQESTAWFLELCRKTLNKYSEKDILSAYLTFGGLAVNGRRMHPRFIRASYLYRLVSFATPEQFFIEKMFFDMSTVDLN